MYDVIILGAGPAGLSAGLYAGRSRMKVLIIEKGGDGGQIAQTADIENYPGQLLVNSSIIAFIKAIIKVIPKTKANITMPPAKTIKANPMIIQQNQPIISSMNIITLLLSYQRRLQ